MSTRVKRTTAAGICRLKSAFFRCLSLVGIIISAFEIVPGASHFMAHAIASPSWRNAYQVATIGDHTFLKVQSLKPRKT